MKKKQRINEWTNFYALIHTNGKQRFPRNISCNSFIGISIPNRLLTFSHLEKHFSRQRCWLIFAKYPFYSQKYEKPEKISLISCNSFILITISNRLSTFSYLESIFLRQRRSSIFPKYPFYSRKYEKQKNKKTENISLILKQIGGGSVFN